MATCSLWFHACARLAEMQTVSLHFVNRKTQTVSTVNTQMEAGCGKLEEVESLETYFVFYVLSWHKHKTTFGECREFGSSRRWLMLQHTIRPAVSWCILTHKPADSVIRIRTTDQRWFYYNTSAQACNLISRSSMSRKLLNVSNS